MDRQDWKFCAKWCRAVVREFVFLQPLWRDAYAFRADTSYRVKREWRSYREAKLS